MTVAGHARRIIAQQDPTAVRDASQDVRYAMETHFGLHVQEASTFASRGEGGWCDGLSITHLGIVLYRATGSRRENFTLAHELAHVLVDNDIEALSWLADRDNRDRELEQLCDVIAARLLVPEATLNSVLANGPPRAATLTALHDATRASWSACAVSVANSLPCEGFVTIIDSATAEVFFSARAHDTRPYAWRGDHLPATHVLRRIEPPTLAVSSWPRFNRNDQRQYYVSSEQRNGFVHAVFAANDLWGVTRLHVGDGEDFSAQFEGHVDCALCGYSGSTNLFPCSTCRTATCQRCGKCDCDRDNAIQRARCGTCTVSVRAHLLEDGVCPGCR